MCGNMVTYTQPFGEMAGLLINPPGKRPTAQGVVIQELVEIDPNPAWASA